MAEKSKAYKKLRALYENQISITDDYRKELKEKGVENDKLNELLQSANDYGESVLKAINRIEEVIEKEIKTTQSRLDEVGIRHSEIRLEGKMQSLKFIYEIVKIYSRPLNNKSKNQENENV